MMVHIGHGFMVACDFCSTEIEVRMEEITSVTAHIKDHGWKMEHGDKRGEVLHRCPCCVEDQAPAEHQIQEAL